MLKVLILLSFLFGLSTAVLMIVYVLHRKFRQSRMWTMVVIFAMLGFVIPSTFSVVALVRNDDSAARAGWLWPTSIMLMAGERGDPVWAILLVLGLAILSNMGVYGVVGLMVGSVWAFFGNKSADISGDR